MAKTTFQDKYKKLSEQVEQKIMQLVNTKGKGIHHDFISGNVLVVKEEQMFNLDGGRYLVAISNRHLIDNRGYEYSYSVFTLEQLCEIVDSFL